MKFKSFSPEKELGTNIGRLNSVEGIYLVARHILGRLHQAEFHSKKHGWTFLRPSKKIRSVATNFFPRLCKKMDSQ